MNSPAVIKLAILSALAVMGGIAFCWNARAEDPPSAEITNGQIRARLYLPDAQHGYYRGTRFDWAGVIASLKYQGHNYYGPWFDRVDPKVYDFGYAGTAVVASPCTAISGPAEEFQTNGSGLGWDEAKVGGTFVKIGIGVLRKDDAKYDFVKLREIVDSGRWTIKKHRDSIEFAQEVADPTSGYAYIYRKTVRLTPGKPEIRLEHNLKNTGRRTIQTAVYNHNFLVLDHQAPGPDFTISVPFQIQSPLPPAKNLAQIRENHLVFKKVLENEDAVFTRLQGFGATPKDSDIRIENIKVGAGLRIRGDRPLSALNFWSMRRVLSVEPFIEMTIEPGGEFQWSSSYEFYTLPSITK